MVGEICQTVMDAEGKGKFWDMWGPTAWHRTQSNLMRCWGETGAAHSFFDSALQGGQCDVNWFEGVRGSMGDQHSRPEFPKSAPALLGFDEDIFAHCSRAMKKQESFELAPGGQSDDFNHELAHRCKEASENILRLLSVRVPWNMCQNLQWVLCSLQGLLPRQKGRKFHFATTPQDLEIGVWEHPTTWPCNEEECGVNKFAVGDVFFAETCMIHRLCRNRDSLFQSDREELVECDLDTDEYWKFTRQLLSPK